ncbi:hypothetical protein, variant [Phytophthora nicotianae CJ01A1]|uniref:Ubiquitin-like domain-containing protein n=6 Tax=Phytophthora nicotianae TaxID=4792 RepID=W2PTF1_PHYN3|nr:hypothetical protein, variant [Phytophthora nicotianae INRA-310]ETI38001.1 hypothetical protein, variant [Phytophthora nicotianae P1569]ETK78197.1 hypothetical protein, variant [Phytophthora nicotianae]ETO66757.1 hypothetical protein, variant [Phytophthora nicotianae P1976]ETP07884.1 hypothetical protein, variant [Phytophthora nicotianae CJ01A1]ETP35919.1 hypothetical protein, variant [Phytophthora nicotianae P10297]KUF79106.1 hypothetical protein AM587_10011988 [Phytophthora nicotianae]
MQLFIRSVRPLQCLTPHLRANVQRLQCIQDAGRTLTVAIANPRAKVQELLTLVEAKQQGLFTQGYLNYGGVPLRASRSLTDYGIQNHATLDLSRRLHGGCFGFSILLWILIFICCLISVCTCGLSLPVALCLLPPALLLPLCCL